MELSFNKLKVDAGGEGSKGGHIIGHTGSGKPIYRNAKHPDHKGFTAKDHDTASVMHGMKASSVTRQSEKTFHNNQAQAHQEGASKIRQEHISKGEKPSEHFYAGPPRKNWTGPPPPHAAKQGWTDPDSGKAVLPGSTEHKKEMSKWS